jgi:hypothetical protein
MYKYLVAFVFLTPLIGIWLVERGEYAPSVSLDGFPNGAAVAYAAYALFAAAIGTVVAVTRRRATSVIAMPAGASGRFRRFATSLLLFNTVFLVLFLFGFGAIDVWLLQVGKGEFRVSLGAFGAIPNLMSKFVVPALLAYAALLYSRTTRKGGLRWLWVANFLVAFVIGASWGFKSTGIFSVLPAILLLYWRVRPAALLGLAAGFAGCLIVFFWIFDAVTEAGTDVQAFLLRRITVLQGDTAWYIWQLHTTGENFPNYWPTLLAAFGDKLLAVLGLSRADSFEWMQYHYDWMLSYVAGTSLDVIAGGHSLTGTPFAEGLIAGGVAGVAIFTLVSGLLIGGMYRFLDRSLRRGRDVAAALGATYFCSFVIPWLNGGAIVQLFHISLLIGLASTLMVLNVMRRLRVSAPAPLPV